jgi:hypothetical protein
MGSSCRIGPGDQHDLGRIVVELGHRVVALGDAECGGLAPRHAGHGVQADVEALVA